MTNRPDRIAYYLDTGEILPDDSARKTKSPAIEAINEESEIETDFVCSEKHRAFLSRRLANRSRLTWFFKNG